MVWQDTVEAELGNGVGASILVDTPVLDCNGDVVPNASDFKAFVQARDALSGRVSNSVEVLTGCFVL